MAVSLADTVGYTLYYIAIGIGVYLVLRYVRRERRRRLSKIVGDVK